MDITSLIRDPKYVHSCLQEQSDESLIALKPCKIYIPTRFEAAGLAQIGLNTQIIGLAAIVFEDLYYGVLNVNAMVRLDPARIERIKINGVEYFEFHIAAGGVVTPNLNLFVSDTVLFDIYNEIVSSAKIPWYLTYEDLGGLFESAPEHAGVGIGRNAEVIETVIAKIARIPSDRAKQYSLAAADPAKFFKTKPTYVPLRSVMFSATNTMTKLAGSYMQHGVVSAIVRPTEKVSRLEGILRA